MLQRAALSGPALSGVCCHHAFTRGRLGYHLCLGLLYRFATFRCLECQERHRFLRILGNFRYYAHDITRFIMSERLGRSRINRCRAF